MAWRCACAPRLGETQNNNALRMKKTTRSVFTFGNLGEWCWRGESARIPASWLLPAAPQLMLRNLHQGVPCEFHKVISIQKRGTPSRYIIHLTLLLSLPITGRLCLGQTPDIDCKNVQLICTAVQLLYLVNAMSSDMPFFTSLNNILPTSMS